MSRPIHRLIWESILYQTFRQTVRHPFVVDFQPDIEFCAKAEAILGSKMFPDASVEDNSPVIGFPLRLQKFIIDVVQLCKSPFEPEQHAIELLKREMEYWQPSILEDGVCLHHVQQDTDKTSKAEKAAIFHRHSTSLHILAASLILHWVIDSHEVSTGGELELPPPQDSWQVRRAVQILRCPQASEEWSRCYLGSWPTLIFGYAVYKAEDVALIRHDMQQRFRALYAGEDLLFLEELEAVWRSRGITT